MGRSAKAFALVSNGTELPNLPALPLAPAVVGAGVRGAMVAGRR